MTIRRCHVCGETYEEDEEFVGELDYMPHYAPNACIAYLVRRLEDVEDNVRHLGKKVRGESW